MKKIRFFICIFFFANLLIFKSSSVSATEVKNVLVLHSYNEGFAWTGAISKGINSVFNDANANINVKYDYMDLKEKSDEQYLESFLNLQKSKYAHIKFNAIIASDNGAMDYLLRYGDKLFPEIPMVFCGVNDINASAIMDKPMYKFISENIEAEAMIKNVLSVFPETSTINIYGSDSLSGQMDFDNIKNITEKFIGKCKFNFYKNTTVEQLKSKIEISNKDTAFIFVTDPFLDADGHYRYINNLKEDIFIKSPAPLFSFWDFDLGYGTIGGKVTSGFYQGEEAAKLALKILNGDDLASIPQITQSPNKYMYDFNQLDRFNINLKYLPEGSIIINSTPSFFEEHKVLVIITVIIFIFLVTIISFLSIIVNQKRKNEIKLNNSYEELSAVYEELAATEEELRAQYEELQQNEEIMRNSEERYRLAIEGSNDAIWEWNIERQTFFISEKWTDITGHAKVTNFMDVYDKYSYEDDREFAKKDLETSINSKEIYKSEFRIIAKDGSIKWLLNRGKLLFNYKDEPIKMAGSITDISERKAIEKQIRYMAYYDMITGLPNRNYFMDKFKEILRSNSLTNKSCALIFLDVDEFKKINDTLGHDNGDNLLKEFAGKLKTSITLDSIAARFGGDEFLVLIPEFNSMKDLENICSNVLRIFKEPFILNGLPNYVTSSMGVVIAPMDGDDTELLLKNADTAMYRAKEQGKNQYCFFNYSMSKDLAKKISIENNLRNALENNEFQLYYQPQINLSNGKIEGMEALIRWKNNELGFVSPNEFIHIAEKNGLIVPIGNWVIKTACAQNKNWLEKGFKYNSIAINVSCVQFVRQDFIDIIKDVLSKESLPSSCIDIEITESLLIDFTEDNINKLKDLKSMGVKVSLDDFGTGYSSLNYLRKLPINKLKIDKSFIQDICEKEEQRIIVDVIINLSHRLGYEVIAEGVETKEELDLLNDMGCDIAQGYYFGKPVSAEEMEQLLIQDTEVY
jgi:diguanylate cyclase (GGDEF)-like protein/PAS domain S-box-containing protein